MFRFGILGAAKIAAKFCDAVSRIEDCTVCAVASKSLERARQFASDHCIPHAYDSYEQLLDMEKPDCVYIAVTVNDHYRLTMLCISKGIPVLCEKAMFRGNSEAEAAFEAAANQKVFLMEAMWSRFLPAVRQAKAWLEAGSIGAVELSQFAIGFAAPKDPANRYWNRSLGGGAALDLTVYAFELTVYLLSQKVEKTEVSVLWSETGVDQSEHISLQLEHTLADLTATFCTGIEEKMVIYGSSGKIVIPTPHYASECFLYDGDGTLKTHYKDDTTKNGFTYEIIEAIRCIREGLLESPVIPWRDTGECAALFDQIEAAGMQK